MKILLLGDVGGSDYYHVGDEAIMSARVDWLKKNFPESELFIYSKDKLFTQKKHHCTSIAIPNLLKKKRFLYKLPWKIIAIFSSQIQLIYKLLKISKLEQLDILFKTDLFWICGGGNINSSCSELIQVRTTLAKIAIALNIPIIVTGQTIGPNLNKSDKMLLQSWFSRVRYLGVRDQQNSVDLAKLLGATPKQIKISLDDAFWLKEIKPNHSIVEKIEKSKKPVIGISFYYRWGQPLKKDLYTARLANLVDKIISETQCNIVALPHTYSTTSFSDIELSKTIRDLSTFKEDFWIFEDFLIDKEIKYLTGKCDYIFSNRFHGIIFGLSQAIPCTGIYQENYTEVKLKSAYNMIGIVPQTISIYEEDIVEKMLNHWYNREQIKHNLNQRIEEARKDQDELDNSLKTLIFSLSASNKLSLR